jgi:HPt (histidine-containing phosphotransfer) domain-containing protein
VDAERLAHTLKAVAGSLGAVRVQEAADTTERAIRERATREEIDAALNSIESALGPVVSELREALPETPAAVRTSAPVDPAQARAAVTELIRLLADFDADAVEFIEGNSDVLQHVFTLDAWSRFLRLAQTFAFSEALALLEEAARAQGFAET